jgi:dTDP-4-dehydrorhamnose 3,5-epimerase
VRATPTRLPGCVVIEPAVHGDERGFFIETYRREWHGELGLDPEALFVQDNHSRSSRGVVRGMHFHVGDGVTKLVRCARGAIVDVVVDLRLGSPTYKRWEAVELSDVNHLQLLVPVGFAHGFCVMSEVADVIYKQTAYYDRGIERGIAYDDAEVGIEWPLAPEEMIVSERDQTAPSLADLADELPFRY